MKKNAKKVRMTIDIPTVNLKKLEALAASQGLSVEDLVGNKIVEFLKDTKGEENQPSSESKDPKKGVKVITPEELARMLSGLS